MDYLQQMRELSREHDYFIGLDSDGCVFDSMEIKHKECFCPAFIKDFKLQPVSKYAREVWEFVNLYSKSRGLNRFLALQESLRWLEERPESQARGIHALNRPSLDQWLREESRLGNPALREKVNATEDSQLREALAWSEEVNQRVAEMVVGIPPFPGVREVLEEGRDKADVIVVSQTPLEALEREWREHGIDQEINLICGQEHGTKTEHLKYCAADKYDADKILMVGDAPGDLKAARENQVLFFPIVCGREEESWHRLYEEGLKRFFSDTFRGKFQDELLHEFEEALPENPPWAH